MLDKRQIKPIRDMEDNFERTKVKPGVVVHAYNPSYLSGRGRRIMRSQSGQSVSETLSQNTNKRAWDVG
jgi:hypothetical protein